MSFLSLGDQNDDESDLFSSPSGGHSSRMVSLFGMNDKLDNTAGSNQSLTYNPPKAPKTDKGQMDVKKPSQEQAPSVSAAAAVTAHKYVQNEYKTQGKLGIALLSNYVEKDYRILMYVSKQQPVTTAKITSDFQFNIQSSNYAFFYDDQGQTWSVLFSSADLLASFAKQVCLARYNCYQSQTSVVVQDLQLGEQETSPLVSGDSVETKYTGWVVESQTGTLGTVFDSNHKTEKTFRFKIGKGKVIKGWEDGMLGIKKGGKRFLVIPPKLAYGSKDAGKHVPPNSTLAFEVDILRIKHFNTELPVQDPSSVNSTRQTPQKNEPGIGRSLEAPLQASMQTTATKKDQTVRDRTTSFEEQVAHKVASDTAKAKLVSRIAKVGQPMWPTQPPSSVSLETESTHAQMQSYQASQSSACTSSNQIQSLMQTPLEISHSPANANSPEIVSQQAYVPNLHAGHQVSSHMPLGMLRNSSSPAANFQLSSGMIPYPGMYHTAPNTMQQYPMIGNDPIPTIFTQKQNLELKLLTEKLDQVYGKVDELKKSFDSRHQGVSQFSTEMMDAEVLSHNIQRIIQENRRLKTQILDRNKQVETQSDKITDLLQQNQKLVEESHVLMEKRNVTFRETVGQSQEKTLLLEQERNELTSRLSNATSKICELQLNLCNITERANSLEKLVRSSKETVPENIKKSNIQDLENKLSAMNEKLEESYSEKTRLKNMIEGKDISLQQERDKMGELRNQLEKRWRKKCEDTVAAVRLAADERVEGLATENEELSMKLETCQKKHNSFREQVVVMKEKYLTAIKHLKESKSQEENVPINTDANIQVKTMMNEVFQQVRAEITPNEEYSGSQVLRVILNIIKSKTMTLLNSSLVQKEENIETKKHQERENEANDTDTVDPNTQALEVSNSSIDVRVSENTKQEKSKQPEIGTEQPPKPIPSEVYDKTEPENSGFRSPAEVTTQGEKEPRKGGENSANIEYSPKIREGASVDKKDTEAQVCERSVSPASDAKPSPPPMLDDDDDDDGGGKTYWSK